MFVDMRSRAQKSRLDLATSETKRQLRSTFGVVIRLFLLINILMGDFPCYSEAQFWRCIPSIYTGSPYTLHGMPSCFTFSVMLRKEVPGINNSRSGAKHSILSFLFFSLFSFLLSSTGDVHSPASVCIQLHLYTYNRRPQFTICDTLTTIPNITHFSITKSFIYL